MRPPKTLDKLALSPAGGTVRTGTDLQRRSTWWIELLIFLGGYWLYHVAQMHAPGTAALRHGWDILRLEHWAHIGVDRSLNAIVSSSRWLAIPAEYYYATLHFTVSLGVLGWLWLRHHDRYKTTRRVLIWISLIALAVFWVFPAAPPRLLPNSGFIDTGLRFHVPLSAESGNASKAADLYATIPSLHFAWALWSAWAVSTVVRVKTVRRLVWLYPVLTGLVVLGTANHSVMDLVAGALVFALGTLVGTRLPERRRRSRVEAARAIPGPALSAGVVVLGEEPVRSGESRGGPDRLLVNSCQVAFDGGGVESERGGP